MQKKDIKLNLIAGSESTELDSKIYLECDFCQKLVCLYPHYRQLYEKISHDRFFCAYCLQNNLNTRGNRNILIASFRGIIGYYDLVLCRHERKLFKSEIEDIIYSHAKAGLLNPAFRYDPESLLWFIDFNKIGHGARKVPVKEVLKTVINILLCFNFHRLQGLRNNDVYLKFEEAILKFYSDRYRPPGKKILCPTLIGCGYWSNVHNEKSFNSQALTSFTSADLRRY